MSPPPKASNYGAPTHRRAVCPLQDRVRYRQPSAAVVTGGASLAHVLRRPPVYRLAVMRHWRRLSCAASSDVRALSSERRLSLPRARCGGGRRRRSRSRCVDPPHGAGSYIGFPEAEENLRERCKGELHRITQSRRMVQARRSGAQLVNSTPSAVGLVSR